MTNQAKKPWLIGHRGFSEQAPENTDLAFALAKTHQFDGVELDVHRTVDGKLVVIHDETITRTSDGSGAIAQLTWSELQRFNFAAKFPQENAFAKILTYQEFLMKYGNTFQIINVEIKTDVVAYPGIEAEILEITKACRPKAKIIYSSFNFASLQRLYELDSNVWLAFLFVDFDDLTPVANQVSKICRFLNPWFKSLFDSKTQQLLKKINLPMIPWTFARSHTPGTDQWTQDSEAMLSQVLKISGVTGIISNSKFFLVNYK